MRPFPPGASLRNEYGRRQTSIASATSSAWRALNDSSAAWTFFLPRYPCGHCVHVTQSAWRISCGTTGEVAASTTREPRA